MVSRYLETRLYGLPFYSDRRSQDFWAWETMFQVVSSRWNADASCHPFLISRQLIQYVVLVMNMSVWASIFIRNARSRVIFVKRVCNLDESVSPWYCCSGSLAVAGAICNARPKRENSIDSRANVLEEPRHDWKTADNDACRKLGPAPQTKRHRQVAHVGRFDNFPRVVSTHDRRHASTKALVSIGDVELREIE